MSNIAIGLTSEQRTAVTGLLRQTLADLYILYTKTRKYHWNVEGPHFSQLHKLFEEQYDVIDEAIDEVAERIRALGLYSPGSFAEFQADARLQEDAGGPLNAQQMLAALLADHEAVIRNLRVDLQKAADLGDAGNSDFLTGLLEGHEKAAWMLRALLA